MSFRQLLSPLLRRFCVSPNNEVSSPATNPRKHIVQENSSSARALQDENTADEDSFQDTENDSSFEMKTLKVATAADDLKTKPQKPPFRKAKSTVYYSRGHETTMMAATIEAKNPPTRANTITEGHLKARLQSTPTVAAGRQESMSKEEARKRMLSWRKTTRSRSSNDQSIRRTTSSRRPPK